MPAPPAEPEKVSSEEPTLCFPAAVAAAASVRQPELAGRENVATALPAGGLWELDIAEVTGHNLEARGREEVNRLLEEGWRLLHIYTLRYREDEVWRERPMAILGRVRCPKRNAEESKAAAAKGDADENPAGGG
jgi:hypothetical protein